MRRRALLMGGKPPRPLIIRVDTTKAGATPSDTFRIPANAPSETYKFKVDWGDGVVTSNHTGEAEHTYLSGGVYDIKIYGKFPKFYFNNAGDRLKLLEVRDWGEIKYSTIQTNAFYGCTNLTFIATDANSWYNGITSGLQMFAYNSLTSLPDNMTLGNLTSGGSMFWGNSLTSLPDGMTLSSLTNGSHMFRDNSLTSLPDGMLLSNLTGGVFMFQNNSLTTLPDGMILNNLTSGSSMFYNNSLTSLPDGMTLSSLTNGGHMFNGNSLTSLPDGMTLGNLTNGASMFNGNSLTSLPDGMMLSSLTNGYYMFAYNASLTELPDNITLETLESGEGMFRGVPLIKALNVKLYNIQGNAQLFMNGANLPNYSEILIDIEANNPNNDVTIHFGSSKYNATGQIARNILTSAPRNWIITDGGLE